MLDFSVDDALCNRCGKCSADCPSKVIVQSGGELPRIPAEKEQYCIQCQHCLAVCPTAAVSILGRNPYDSMPAARDRFPSSEVMMRFVRARRSVRQYKEEDVDPELIRKLLHAVANAPSGINSRQRTFRLIDSRAVMAKMREKVMGELKAALDAGRLTGPAVYLAKAIPPYFEEKRDIIFRGAPHALIISAPPDAPCPHEDVVLALAYFELLAQSAGLGTVWWGLLKMCLEVLPDLKPLFGVPAGHSYYGMLFGLPAISYARTVQRDDSAKIVRIDAVQ